MDSLEHGSIGSPGDHRIFSGDINTNGGHSFQGNDEVNVTINHAVESDPFKEALYDVLGKNWSQKDQLDKLTVDRIKLVDKACEWIMSTGQFKDWVHREGNRLLWVHGSPGIGKTSLAHYLAKLESWPGETRTDNSRIFHYHFFQDARTTPQHALASLLNAIIDQAPDDLKEDVLTRAKKERTLSIVVLSRLLLDIFQFESCKGKIYCLFDGIDKWEKEKNANNLAIFLKAISDLLEQSQEHQQLKIIFFCQKTAYLSSSLQLKSDREHMLDLDSDASSLGKSIESFIEEKMRELPFRTSALKDIRETLMDKAGGTYLWVGPMIGALAHPRAGDYKSVLNRLPDPLMRRYSQMQPAQEESWRILGYVAAAYRPLNLKELCQLMHKREEDMKTELIACCHLLKYDPATETINLIHESVKEFLAAKKSSRAIVQKAHAKMGTISFKVVQDSELKNQRSSLSEYAVYFWPRHLASSDWKELKWRDNLRTDPAWLQSWLSEYWRTVQPLPGLKPPKPFHMIHVAAFFGMTWFVQSLVNNGDKRDKSSLNATTSGGMTPLHWAACEGHSDTVKCLLDSGMCQIEGKGYGMTPLIWATHNKHYDVVKLLLQKKAKTDETGFGMTALQWAVWFQDDEMVELILQEAESKSDCLGDTTIPCDSSSFMAENCDSAIPRPAQTLHKLLTFWTESDVDFYKVRVPQTKSERFIVAQHMETRRYQQVLETQRETTIIIFAMALVAVIAQCWVLCLIAWNVIGPLISVIDWSIEQWLSITGSFLLIWTLVAAMSWRGLSYIATKVGLTAMAGWAGFMTGWATLSSFATVMGEGPIITEVTASLMDTYQAESMLTGMKTRLYSSLKRFTYGREKKLPPPTLDKILRKVALVLAKGIARWILELPLWTAAFVLGFWWANRGRSHTIVWALLLTSWVVVGVWEATMVLADATSTKDTSVWTLIAMGSITMTLAGYVCLAGVLATLKLDQEWRTMSRMRYVLGVAASSSFVAVCFVAFEPIPKLRDKMPWKAACLFSFVISFCLSTFAVLAACGLRALQDIISYYLPKPTRKRYGHTALHLAALRGNLTLTGRLLDAGADPKSLDRQRRTARDLALRANCRDVAERLQRSMETRMTPE